MEHRRRILSGVQPSGKLHLGNYFGAIEQHIALQDHGEAFYFIADYHAMTTLPDATAKEAEDARRANRPARPAKQILADNVRDVALDYLALGLDPAKATFYRQSDVPEVCELAWMLSTITGMGLLERAHSFKDKTARGISSTVGLFSYPILMAADILIVRSHLVPVGKDQVQHLEMTRDMAGYFNQAYGELFPLPQEHLGETPAVPGTDGQKMSKSYANTIEIFAEGKALEKAVMSIVTDSTAVDAPKNADTCNVVALYKLFASTAEVDQLIELYKNPMMNAEARQGKPFGFGHSKKLLLAKIDARFAEARDRRKLLERDPALVEEVLRCGARRARTIAQVTMSLARQAIGLLSAPVG